MAVPAARRAGTFLGVSLHPVVHIIGLFVTALGVMMLVPAIIDGISDHPDWRVFVTSSAFTVFVGLGLTLATSGPIASLNVHQGFLLTTGVWLSAAAAAAVPLMFSGLDLDFTDAFFEAMSALTTTGSTVVTGLDTAPPGILIWRGILQWVGGIGFIVVGVAILPFLRVGGMQLFRLESSEKSDKAVPQVKRFATLIILIYVVLSVACALSLAAAGMSPLEASVHAMTTLSTGGFSTSDSSVGYFQNPTMEWIIIVFMLAGSLPFLLYLRFLQGKVDVLFGDQQVRSYLRLLVLVILALTTWLVFAESQPPLDALRMVAFNVVSVVTTTGFASTDYTRWGDLAVIVFFLLTFVGGCTGSTSGGLKAFRFEVLSLALRIHVHRLIYPHGTFVAAYNGRRITDDIFNGVLLFMAVYVIVTACTALLLGIVGLDLVTALSGAATAVGNVGPGLGPVIGPAGTFAPLPDAAKWILALAMLLGRLELFTVLALFARGFWRQ